MYVPKHFEESNLTVLHALIESHPLGAWVVQQNGELNINHLPFLVDRTRGDHGTLIGHVSKQNPVWRALDASTASAVIFQGPEAYVTPSWYPSKQAHGKVVPTWNYAVVHAHGRPRAIQDREWLLEHVTRLVDTHEHREAQPWKVTDAPADYIDAMLRAIVGIEIPIDRIEGKWKVSQNRSAEDAAGAAAGLLSRDDARAEAMGALVRERSS